MRVHFVSNDSRMSTLLSYSIPGIFNTFCRITVLLLQVSSSIRRLSIWYTGELIIHHSYWKAYFTITVKIRIFPSLLFPLLKQFADIYVILLVWFTHLFFVIYIYACCYCYPPSLQSCPTFTLSVDFLCLSCFNFFL